MAKELEVFEKWPYKLPKVESINKKLDEFIEKFKAAPTQEEALKVIKNLGKYMDGITNEITHVQVLFSIDTTNKKYKKGMDYLNENLPLVQVKEIELQKLILESKFRPYLESKLGSLYFTMIEYSLKGFSEEVVEESIEENRLSMEYSSLVASAKIEFRGETYNLPQMSKFMEDKDRNTRKEAAEVYYSFLEKLAPSLEEIYDKLVHVRDRKAKKLGFKDYVELGYINMSRFDYNREDVASYREEIHDVVTPIYNKLLVEQFKRAQIKDPHIYDIAVKFNDGNPMPLGDTAEKIEKAKKMYDDLSPETSYFFRFMSDHHVLDLEAKPGKQSGGYMTYFPKYKIPFIFSNFNGTSGDVDVLTHEFGHSFQAYMSRNIKIPEYRSPTAESCEIHSMSMEFFAHPWMNLFFDDPEKYRYLHLSDSIMFLPYGVTVDEFQHWVYENPNATIEERNQKWHELELKYTPEKVKVYKECEYMNSGRRWLLQAHIFECPFYYIDYTLAQVMAFEFLLLNLKNHDLAWKRYLKICAMGGKYPFRTLVTKDKMKDPFVKGTIAKTVKPLLKVLKSYNI